MTPHRQEPVRFSRRVFPLPNAETQVTLAEAFELIERLRFRYRMQLGNLDALKDGLMTYGLADKDHPIDLSELPDLS